MDGDGGPTRTTDRFVLPLPFFMLQVITLTKHLFLLCIRPAVYPLILENGGPNRADLFDGSFQGTIVLDGVPPAALAALQEVGYLPVELAFSLGTETTSGFA